MTQGTQGRLVSTPLPQGSQDRFDRIRETLSGAPGFQHRMTTLVPKPEESFLFSTATWFVETVKTDDGVAIFLQFIDKDGGQRMVLPQKVCEAIYRQEYRVKKARRSAAAKRASETRMAHGIIPFQKKKNPDSG